MGLFSLFKKKGKKIHDEDLCLLRDLYVIAFNNDGPTLQKKTEDIINDATKRISVEKKANFLSIDPERIEDVYPLDPEEKDKYLFTLFYIWRFSGNRNRNNSYEYIRKVSVKMGMSEEDLMIEYEAVMSFAEYVLKK